MARTQGAGFDFLERGKPGPKLAQAIIIPPRHPFDTRPAEPVLRRESHEGGAGIRKLEDRVAACQPNNASGDEMQARRVREPAGWKHIIRPSTAVVCQSQFSSHGS